MQTILLVNPNSNADTTAAMCRIAAPILRRFSAQVTGWTATLSSPLLTSPAMLAQAAAEVAELTPPTGCAGVMVSAFGDPGRAGLAARLSCPVVGIGASAARAAGRDGRAFGVATTTPALRQPIDRLMLAEAGQGRYVGSFYTAGDPAALMTDPAALDDALLSAIDAAVAAGAAAVIIGGGPLGEAAARLRDRRAVPLIEPIPEAARRLGAQLESTSD